MANALVLIIDDEAGPRESLRMILKPHYDVLLAETPSQGLELARQQQPDLVFCDIKMPEMEGPEVLRRLKEIDPEVQVALITAYAAVDTAQKAVRYGACDYITKPFAVEDILAVARRAVERRRELLEQRALLAQLKPAAQALSGQLAALGTGSAPADSHAIIEDLTAAHSSIEGQLAKIAKLNAIGEVAAEVAHDVRNFLLAILLRIELLTMKLKHADRVEARLVHEDLEAIVQAAQDGAQAVQRISGLSQADPYEPSTEVDINALVSEVLALVNAQFQATSGARVVVAAAPVPVVLASPAALRTVLMNLVINARQALKPEGGTVQITTGTEGGQALICVQDDGVGMSPENLARATEAFFTTKGESGTGLGLSIAQKIINAHRGTLELTSTEGVGTTVRIRLPALETGPAAASADTEAAPAPVADVLVVDDDERVLNSMRAVLLAGGLTTEGARHAGEALEKFENALKTTGQAPRIVVTDLRLPGLLGTDLARRIKELAPTTRVVLVSGYIGERAGSSPSPYIDAIVGKPFDARELLRVVQS